jgi:hypothetical protein
LHISYGRWEEQPHNPNQAKEKLTDVKLATSLVRDALWPRERAANPKSALFDPEHLYEDDDPPAPFDKAISANARSAPARPRPRRGYLSVS